MRGRRSSALARGEAKGWALMVDGVPREAYAVWQDRAREERQLIRAAGGRGETERQDLRVSGKRGRAVASEVFANALDAARRGVSEEESVGLAVKAAALTIRLAYAQAMAEAGPRAS